MPSKTVRRSVRVRRSPVPRASSAGITSGFVGLLAKLAGASTRLERARPRR